MRELVVSSFKELKIKHQMEKDKIIVYVFFLLSIIVAIFINGVVLSSIKRSMNVTHHPYLILLLVNFLFITSLISSFYALIINNKKKSYINQLNNSSEIIQILRKQKHDFHNHINVISGYIQLNKANKALDYAFEVCENPNEIFNIAKIINPLIASNLYDRYLEAKSIGVDVELYINSSLQHLKIESSDFITLLNTLIDFSISKLKIYDYTRELTIDIDEDDDMYIITIINSSLFLDRNNYNDVFDEKSDNGLYKVKKIVKKYNGDIDIQSDVSFGAMFIISLNK